MLGCAEGTMRYVAIKITCCARLFRSAIVIASSHSSLMSNTMMGPRAAAEVKSARAAARLCQKRERVRIDLHILR